MMKQFKFLTGDMNPMDHGGSWYRCVDDSGLCYHVISSVRWDECDSNPEHTYLIDLDIVDLGILDIATIQSAMDSCGYEDCKWFQELTPAQKNLALVEACHGYGAKVPVTSCSGNNWHKMMRDARAESHSLDYDEVLDRPVNAIGSTGTEFANACFLPAIARGVMEGNSKANLLAKMYGLQK